jgi:hypothetical protein
MLSMDFSTLGIVPLGNCVVAVYCISFDSNFWRYQDEQTRFVIPQHEFDLLVEFVGNGEARRWHCESRKFEGKLITYEIPHLGSSTRIVLIYTKSPKVKTQVHSSIVSLECVEVW